MDCDVILFHIAAYYHEKSVCQMCGRVSKLHHVPLMRVSRVGYGCLVLSCGTVKPSTGETYYSHWVSGKII